LTIPHLAFPFRLTGRGANVLEQDTLEEIAQGVQVLVTTRLGERQELPDYGTPDPVFLPQTGDDLGVIQAQIERKLSVSERGEEPSFRERVFQAWAPVAAWGRGAR